MRLLVEIRELKASRDAECELGFRFSATLQHNLDEVMATSYCSREKRLLFVVRGKQEFV